ncbi:Calcium-dependent protein kinase 7 [Hordeum vulgare]|nr:Calcium-dependent protein kinase 7 [Hordeum vulgare]
MHPGRTLRERPAAQGVISATTRVDAAALLCELHNQILAGHASFVDLAVKHSNCSSARHGGVLARSGLGRHRREDGLQEAILSNRMPVDVEDACREVEIMRHMAPHSNAITLNGAYDDKDSVHHVMELYKDGELFDSIVLLGHYTERVATDLTRTIVEVLQVRRPLVFLGCYLLLTVEAVDQLGID